MRIEPADPGGSEARRLLQAHAHEMTARYPGGAWAGVDADKQMLWLARDRDGEAVGCVALRALPDGRVEVKHLFVMPHARRHGVAGALMDALEAEAARRGAEIILETGIRQPEAIALYRSRGYTARERYPGADADPVCSIYLGATTSPGADGARPHDPATAGP